ncbi:MAG: toxin-antitoxin system HicB family antitoxin [Oscillospiraceae bacterium]|jgi:predicted HicB family RNase H-like nuclease|nr:toxin-antitoxin system HicB family antitoxin [Oscillospiraceae bacterium]MCI8878825.1 toxin-antitoxin system HicB family antitoxin [Oscillospiraceae bacterium]
MEKFVPKKPEKETISVRISTSLLQKVEAKAAAADISRNEFIMQCILYAMDHLGESSE